MNRWAVSLACASLTIGCASTNPIEVGHDTEVIEVALTRADGEIKLSGFGNWYANFKGFSLLHPLPRFTPGVIVVTNNSVTLTTRAVSLVGTRRISIQDIEFVELASLGLNRRVVLCKKDLQCDSFDFTKPNSDLVDAGKVEQAAAYLRSVLAQNANSTITGN